MHPMPERAISQDAPLEPLQRRVAERKARRLGGYSTVNAPRNHRISSSTSTASKRQGGGEGRRIR